MASNDPFEQTSSQEPKRKSPMLLISMIIIVAIAAVGGAAYWFNRSNSEEQQDQTAAAKKTAIYQSLDPSFVINLADLDQARYLQIEISVMARDQDTIDAIRLHMPRIRNQLLLLFSQRRYDDVRTREAREQLQKLSLEEVQRILKSETGKPGVEALYFTVFVTQ